MKNALYQRFSDIAQQYTDKTALIDGARRFSYQEIATQAERWALYLQQHLPNQTPRICVLSEDPWVYICLSLAIARLNGCCVPTHCHMHVEQLETAWQASDINLVVYDPAFHKTVVSCQPHTLLKTPSTIELPTLSQDDSTFIANQHQDENTDFLITLSSGSTGSPKPIAISQSVKLKRAEQTWSLYRLQPKDVVLCASPFFHSMGQRLVFVPLLLGCTMVHLGRFTPHDWVEAVKEHHVSFVIAVSTHLYALKDKLIAHSTDLQSLQTIVTSSAPIDAQFKQMIFEKIGCDFHEIYGATEVAVATNLAPKDAQTKFATVGLPCENIEVIILDDHAHPCKADTIGEIAVRSPLAFSGYYKRPDLTEQASHDGYFKTGDLGFVDRDGFLSYVSRKKDIIISGGINIYPGDIENALSSHDNILQVAAIGISDDLLGEIVVAVCRIKHEEARMEAQLRRVANRKLAPFQRPLKYFFVDEFPLTNSGKLSKLKLREIYTPLNKDWTVPLRLMMYGESERSL